ncbi:hypothetical protein RDI58_014894 [Solanum bulbocastanum]|uniref:Uncharacterized protein n=1 Tax=Solanum bulbocastanum TaxID=147425 RepID=A0AAN8YB04_SOLBU
MLGDGTMIIIVSNLRNLGTLSKIVKNYRFSTNRFGLPLFLPLLIHPQRLRSLPMSMPNLQSMRNQ